MKETLIRIPWKGDKELEPVVLGAVHVVEQAMIDHLHEQGIHIPDRYHSLKLVGMDPDFLEADIGLTEENTGEEPG